MTSLMIVLVIAAVATTMIGLGLQKQLVYGWPAGTTEAQKDKILAAKSMDDLSLEEFGIAEDRMYEIFDAFDPDSQEYKDLMDCGFVDKSGFEVLQCWEKKGHTVR